jgi:hypothetical protein
LPRTTENNAYKNLPLEEEVLTEILMDAKKRELEIALSKIPDTNDVILWSKNKRQISKSNRGSRFRGVSRNGKKWQV